MNKKLSLVNPYSEGKGSIVSSGVRILSGIAMEFVDKNNIQVLDGNFHKKNNLIEILNIFDPDILGVSVFSDNKKEAKQILQQSNARIKVVGGPYVTMLPGELIADSDYTFIGESEESFKQFLHLIKQGSVNDIKNISGIAYLEGNKIISTQIKKTKIDLNKIPIDCWMNVQDYLSHMKISSMWHLKDNLVNILASRGCDNFCKFCLSSKIHGKEIRFTNTDVLEREIELINKLREEKGIPHLESIIFDDSDLFFRSKTQLISLSNLLKKYNLTYSAFASIENVREDYLEILKGSGLKTLFFGIETNEKMRPFISKGKKFSDSYAKEVLDCCRLNGIYTATGFIIGYPDEDEKDIIETLECMNNLPSDYPGVGILDLHPGTYFSRYKQRNLYKYTKIFGAHANDENSSPNLNLERSELEDLIKLGYQQAYYNSKRVDRLESIKDEFDFKKAKEVMDKKRMIK